MFRFTSYAEKQTQIDDFGVCPDSDSGAHPLQMAATPPSKSLETMSRVILNRSQPQFEAKSLANEMQCLKDISEQR